MPYYHTAFVLTKSGKYLSTGHNHDRTVLHGKFCGQTMHAEIHALNNLFGKKNNCRRNKINVYVIRETADGRLVNSRPCNNCLDFMKKYHVHKVYYSTDDGTIKVEKLRDMSYIHKSLGWRSCHPSAQKFLKVSCGSDHTPRLHYKKSNAISLV